jgi:hypothetical protein
MLDGGGTFNITSSQTTAISIEATAGILNYNAGGKPVSAGSPPAGEISQTGMQLVQYSGIETVNVDNRTATPSPQSCKLWLSGTKIKLPKTIDRKPRGEATLTAVTTCRNAAWLRLSGNISVLTNRNDGKRKYREYELGPFKARANAGSPTRITLRIPAAIETALKSQEPTRATFKISEANGSTTLAKVTGQRIT